MLHGNKSTGELRFELLVLGTILIVAAVLYVVLPNDLRSLMLFLPGLILLGAAIYQDMQTDWRAGWVDAIGPLRHRAAGARQRLPKSGSVRDARVRQVPHSHEHGKAEADLGV